jgi:hypothetical protein
MTDQPHVLTVPVQWDGVSFPKSRSNCGVFKLVSTAEIMGKDERDTFRHLVDDDAVGHMIFVPNGADPASVKVPTERAREREFKSHSQRLRAVLFVKWRADGEPGDFESWYASEMSYVINSYKELLPERDR